MRSLLKRSALAALCVLAALTGGCERQEKSMEGRIQLGTAQPRIARALDEMLQREEQPFVIVKTATGSAVQFTGSVDEPLLLNLPLDWLSEDERARAEALFAEYDITVEADDNYYMELDRDPQRGAELAMRILREVYRFGDEAELRLTEN
jgi:hypothetical protein